MKSGVGSLQILVPKPIQNALKLKDRDTLLIKVQKVGEGKPKRKDVAKNLKHGKQENPMQKQPVVKLPKIEMFGDLEEWEQNFVNAFKVAKFKDDIYDKARVKFNIDYQAYVKSKKLYEADEELLATKELDLRNDADKLNKKWNKAKIKNRPNEETGKLPMVKIVGYTHQRLAYCLVFYQIAQICYTHLSLYLTNVFSLSTVNYTL